MSRPRGFIADYNPRAKTRALLDQVEEVLDSYKAELPLTARQIFYRLVGAHGYEKNEAAYGRLQEHLANSRRAGVVDFAAIRDDGTAVEAPTEYASPEEFLRIAEGLAAEGQGVRLAGQPRWIEVWCEAAGMAPQLARVVGRYGITVYSSGGFDSLTVKYEAAKRIGERDVPTVILHVGDHDPSGLALFEAAAEDVAAFAAEFDGAVEFRRAAVTPEQIERFNLPTAPPKKADKRSAWKDGDGTVQAEALPPDLTLGVAQLAPRHPRREVERQGGLRELRITGEQGDAVRRHPAFPQPRDPSPLYLVERRQVEGAAVLAHAASLSTVG